MGVYICVTVQYYSTKYTVHSVSTMVCNTICLVVIMFIHIICVSTKVQIVASKDILNIKVGADILGRMGKDGIEFEKIKNSEEVVKEPSKNETNDDLKTIEKEEL